MKLTRTNDEKLVDALHTLIFPDDDTEDYSAAWVLYDRDFPCGFCTVRLLKGEPGVFLTRAGILPIATGKGLQRRMIRAREKWAREKEAEFALTYASTTNHASICNLIKCDYRLYEPSHKWGGDEMLYFYKKL